MRHQWPEGTLFQRLALVPENRSCRVCGRYMHLCDHRHRRVFSLGGPLHIVSKLAHCPDKTCAGRHKTFSAEAELTIAPPHWFFTWDAFAWMGHRRFARHWSVPQIHAELLDRYGIDVSVDVVERYVKKYQCIVAARHQDEAQLVKEYEGVEDVILTIDGLQPEKGHETLYAVRELRRKRVWFAESLISSSYEEVRGLLEKARDLAKALGKPVRAWVSDKQDAFVKGIAEIFPGVPHRYCKNHFLRGLAKPMLDADSSAKVKMRRKVRGLRGIERKVLDARREAAEEQASASPPDATVHEAREAEANSAAAGATSLDAVEDQGEETHAGREGLDAERGESNLEPAALATRAAIGSQENMSVERDDEPVATRAEPPQAQGGQIHSAGEFERQDVVLDYCSGVRGILNDNQGGPLEPPGLRMAAALGEVRESLRRVEAAKKGGRQRTGLAQPTSS